MGVIFDCLILLLAVAIKNNDKEEQLVVKPAIYLYFNHIVLCSYCLYIVMDGLSLLNLGYALIVLQAYLSMERYYSRVPTISWIKNMRILNFAVISANIVF